MLHLQLKPPPYSMTTPRVFLPIRARIYLVFYPSTLPHFWSRLFSFSFFLLLALPLACTLALNSDSDSLLSLLPLILLANKDEFQAWEKVPQALRSHFTNSSLKALSAFPSDWPEVEYLLTSALFGRQQNFIADVPNDGYNYATVAVALVAPLSRGTIDIQSSDMSDPPLINPNWLTHPADQEVVVAAYKRARQLFTSSAMKPIIIGPEYFPGPALNVTTDAQILNFVRQSFNTVFHAACTCKMGRSNDSMAVVDSHARVFGVQGLRVVDASAFPLLPPGHPMSTICMYWIAASALLISISPICTRLLITYSRCACGKDCR